MNVYIGTSGELKGAYIGEYIEQTYTLTWVPTGDINTYISIAKSWYKVSSVKFTYTTTVWTSENSWVRISWNNSNVDRYWIWVTTNNPSTNVIKIDWRLNSWSDNLFKTYSRNTWTNNVEFTIKRWTSTLIVSGANTVNETWTQTTTEQNIVGTIMNSSTMNCYASRDAWWTVSDITITVTYEKN